MGDLQAQLATAQEQILNLRGQQANFLAVLTVSNSSFGEPADYNYDYDEKNILTYPVIISIAILIR